MGFESTLTPCSIGEYRIDFDSVEDRNEWYDEFLYRQKEFGDIFSVTKGLHIIYEDKDLDYSSSLFIVCTHKEMTRIFSILEDYYKDEEA